MNILVTGASGFVGSKLVDYLLKQGHEVLAVGRHAPRQKIDYYEWDLNKAMLPVNTLRGIQVVIHLSGENIFGRWTYAKRKRIRESRIKTTQNLVEAIRQTNIKPRTFISASGIGFYGNKGNRKLDESSKGGRDFLAQVCRKWEAEARQLDKLGIRTVQIRTAPVLGRSGILSKLLPFFKLGLGGTLGLGKQWSPWIHIDDLVRIYEFAATNKKLAGPVNAVSPDLVTNKEFTKTLGKVIHRPTFFMIPKFALRLRYGKLTDAITASQKAIPKKLDEAGFKFKYPLTKKALGSLLN